MIWINTKHTGDEQAGHTWLMTSLIIAVITTFSVESGIAEDKPMIGQENTATPQHDSHLQAHWSYRGIEGPEHWAMLSPEYLSCEAGSQQSPINIHAPQQPGSQENIAFHYRPTDIHVANNGHTVQVDYKSRSVLHVGDRVYYLRQFHFHLPSEHEIEGIRYPMELHLVHQDLQGHIVVVGVFIVIGTKNPWLAGMCEWIPKNTGEVATPLTMNVARVLPENTHHYSYRGSLTTPPCKEGVQWILLKDLIQISEEQRQQFLKIIGENARPVQPLHERQVQEY